MVSVYPVLVVMIWLSTVRCLVSGDESLITANVGAILQEVCPYVKVCQDDMIIQQRANWTYQMIDWVPCCKECSCSKDCKKHKNCCFRTKPEANISTQCTLPSTKNEGKTNIANYSFYDLVNGVPADKHCGEKKVASWGTLWPVYSKEKRRIYKNSACAEAEDVIDGVRWDAYISCKQEKTGSEENHFTHFIDQQFIGPLCHVEFLYPGHEEDLKTEICYKNMIDHCSDSYKASVNDSFLTYEIVQACESGLVSPYTKDKLYANAFCFHCNGGDMWKDVESGCTSHNSNTPRKNSGFSALLIPRTGSLSNQEIANSKEQLPIVCRKMNDTTSEENCRTLHCPPVQQRDSSGNCRSILGEIYGLTYEVLIQLTVTQSVDINEAFGSSGSLNTSGLLSPWPDYWLITSIYLEERKDNQPSILLTKIVFSTEVSDIDLVIDDIVHYINKPWILKLNMTEVELHADLMDKNYYSSDTFSRYSSTINVNEEDVVIRFQKFAVLYKLNENFINTVHALRTVFCEQVEISGSEFVLSEDRIILLNKLTNEIIHKTDFLLISNSRARVCLDKSGFEKSFPNAGSPTPESMDLFTVLFCLYLLKTLQ